ncbi:MAG: hypothetical protein ABIH34_06325 [Nanoarchaeota archaeon]
MRILIAAMLLFLTGCIGSSTVLDQLESSLDSFNACEGIPSVEESCKDSVEQDKCSSVFSYISERRQGMCNEENIVRGLIQDDRGGSFEQVNEANERFHYYATLWVFELAGFGMASKTGTDDLKEIELQAIKENFESLSDKGLPPQTREKYDRLARSVSFTDEDGSHLLSVIMERCEQEKSELQKAIEEDDNFKMAYTSGFLKSCTDFLNPPPAK